MSMFKFLSSIRVTYTVPIADSRRRIVFAVLGSGDGPETGHVEHLVASRHGKLLRILALFVDIVV